MKQPRPGFSNLSSYRVIYGDTDQMGVAYYANYLRWFERGRSEFLRELGVPYGVIEQRGTHFPVTQVSCRYFKSARYDDLIIIETRLTTVARASLVFAYRIRNDADHSLLAEGSTKHACVDEQGRVMRIAEDLRKLLCAAVAPSAGL